MRYIKQKINSIADLIDEILYIEENEGTFSNDALEEWIQMLKDGRLPCPCQEFGYSVDDNCMFYEFRDCGGCGVCEDCNDYDECEWDHTPIDCQEFCDDCYGYTECAECDRSFLWGRLIHKGQGFRMKEKLADWFIGQMVAQRLEKLLNDL